MYKTIKTEIKKLDLPWLVTHCCCKTELHLKVITVEMKNEERIYQEFNTEFRKQMLECCIQTQREPPKKNCNRSVLFVSKKKSLFKFIYGDRCDLKNDLKVIFYY